MRRGAVPGAGILLAWTMAVLRPAAGWKPAFPGGASQKTGVECRDGCA